MGESNLASLAQKRLRDPINRFQNKIKHVFWHYYYSKIPQPKVKSWVPHCDEMLQDKIVNELKQNCFRIKEFFLDLTDYNDFMNRACYHKFQYYYGGGKSKILIEKSLEHYLAAKLLDLSKDDVFIDVASGDSPVAEIYHNLYNCRTYRQDLLFPEGVSGGFIGGDASNMPVGDGFATKMSLHCSFEHFEQNSDTLFI